jgi:hypothetical protein
VFTKDHDWFQNESVHIFTLYFSNICFNIILQSKFVAYVIFTRQVPPQQHSVPKLFLLLIQSFKAAISNHLVIYSLRWPRDTLYPLKFELTSPTRSLGRYSSLADCSTGVFFFIIKGNFHLGKADEDEVIITSKWVLDKTDLTVQTELN